MITVGLLKSMCPVGLFFIAILNVLSFGFGPGQVK